MYKHGHGVQQNDLCLAKTLRVRRINDLQAHLRGALFAMIP
jgi:hypothetical protein